MNRLIPFLAGLLVLVMPVISRAQSSNREVLHRVNAAYKDFGSIDKSKSATIVKETVRCVYKGSKFSVRKLLSSSDPMFVNIMYIGNLQIEQCLTRQGQNIQLKIEPTSLRYSLMEEDYLASVPLNHETLNRPVDVGRIYFSPPDRLQRAHLLGGFADCLAAKNPEGLDILLRTVPSSTEERNRAKDLTPTIAQCLDSGQEITLKTSLIRSYAADGLWTRFVSPQITKAGAR